MGGYVKEPCALYSVAEYANIRTPKDMEGKTIGGPPGDVCILLLQPVMERAGADFSKVKAQNMDAPTRIPIITAKYWKLPRKPAPTEVFTNDFIEWAHAQLKK